MSEATEMEKHTANAVGALRHALEMERDFSGWLANVLATVAEMHPDGVDALTAGRPDCWEAQHVEALASGGWSFEHRTA